MNPAQQAQFPVEEVWDSLDVTAAWEGNWKHFLPGDQARLLADLQARAAVPVEVWETARSPHGVPIHLIEFGNPRGRKVLAWARQHGDEPECSAALMTVLQRLLCDPNDPVCRAILETCRFRVMPMVNPDGTQLYTRRNALGVDLNRDARLQATAEGAALVKAQADFEPEFAFNLHDMRPRRLPAEGRPGLAALAFQSCPFNEENEDNPQRLKAKSVIAEMLAAVKTQTPHVARYTADYMARGFGDAMMAWGAASILIESGSATREEGGDEFVIRLHALAFLAGLYAIATGADGSSDAETYETIPYDDGTFDFDVILRGGDVFDMETGATVRGDLGWETEVAEFRTDKCRQFTGRITSAGDLFAEWGREEYDVQGCLVTPGLVAACDEFPDEKTLEHLLLRGCTTVVTSAETGGTPGAPPINHVVVPQDALKRLSTLCAPLNDATACNSLAANLRNVAAELHGCIPHSELLSLRPGAQADVVVWRLGEQQPHLVFLNGELAVRDGLPVTPRAAGRRFHVH